MWNIGIVNWMGNRSWRYGPGSHRNCFIFINWIWAIYYFIFQIWHSWRGWSIHNLLCRKFRIVMYIWNYCIGMEWIGWGYSRIWHLHSWCSDMFETIIVAWNLSLLIVWVEWVITSFAIVMVHIWWNQLMIAWISCIVAMNVISQSNTWMRRMILC